MLDAGRGFIGLLALTFSAMVLAMMGALFLRISQGDLTQSQAGLFLGVLYWGTYPLVFAVLGLLAVHTVRRERGQV